MYDWGVGGRSTPNEWTQARPVKATVTNKGWGRTVEYAPDGPYEELSLLFSSPKIYGSPLAAAHPEIEKYISLTKGLVYKILNGGSI